MSAHDLHGRAALITGGGVGIGKAIALALGEAGATIGIHYHASAADAEATLAELRSRGGNGFLLQGDLCDEARANEVVQAFADKAGRIDILVNNAGSPLQKARIEDCPTELWRRVMDVNLTSAFFVTRRAIPHLRVSGHGSIINNLTLSIQTTGGAGGTGPYAIAKGALKVMTRTLARELAPAVRVNAIMPGVIETRHHQVFSTPEKLEEYRRATPLGRNGTPEEVAQAVLFLASDASSFTTGALIDINGGRFMR
jgi:3-oxoacyl-[acyl-carrier protein] reductase